LNQLAKKIHAVYVSRGRLIAAGNLTLHHSLEKVILERRATEKTQRQKVDLIELDKIGLSGKGGEFV
jgi:hypothetical protein